LRQLPRGTQHPAFERRQEHGEREEPAQDVRQVPRRRGNALRDQPGPRGGRSRGARCSEVGAAVLPADYPRHRSV
jgi:hypothetical protein